MQKEDAIAKLIHHAKTGYPDTCMDLEVCSGLYSTHMRFSSNHDYSEGWETIFTVTGSECIDTYPYSEEDIDPEDWIKYQSGKLIDDDAVCELIEKIENACKECKLKSNV